MKALEKFRQLQEEISINEADEGQAEAKKMRDALGIAMKEVGKAMGLAGRVQKKSGVPSGQLSKVLRKMMKDIDEMDVVLSDVEFGKE